MAYIVEPLALLFWTAWRILSSVDQKIYWVLLIVFSSLFITYQLLPGNETAPRSLYKEKQNSPSRVEHWQRLVRHAAFGKDGSEALHANLRTLLHGLVEENAQFNPRDVDVDELHPEGRVSLPLPLAVQAFLSRSGQVSETPQHKVAKFTPTWLRNRVFRISERDHSVIDEMLHWMENELEIDNGK